MYVFPVVNRLTFPAAKSLASEHHVPLPESDETMDDARRLVERLQSYAVGNQRRIVVAFSGGVDSSVVAAAATKAAGEDAIAVTARSPSVPKWQLRWANQLATEIGINHQIVETKEYQRPDYVRNDTRRCYYCKETLYSSIGELMTHIGESFSGAAIVSGTNADDLGDYRPGIEAGKLAGVETPLADLGITKPRVRALAEHFGLSNHDLPASPCLASRVAYGVEVTPDRLARIEEAESWLREKDFSDVRVRLHQDELARIELTAADFLRACDPPFAETMHETFRRLGFRFVTIDIGGLQSGSMNRELVTLGVAHATNDAASDPDTASNKEPF